MIGWKQNLSSLFVAGFLMLSLTFYFDCGMRRFAILPGVRDEKDAEIPFGDEI
jgi:hypothetical protein